MKKLSILTAMLAGSVIAVGQSSSTMITYKEKMQPALLIQIPNTTEVAEGTILQKLKETGYEPQTKGKLFWKKNKSEDFYVFNNVKLVELNNMNVDMYFKVTPSVSDKKQSSTVYLMVSKGYDNFVSLQSDTTTYQAAQKFLDGFVAGTNAFKNNLDIDAQQVSITGAEKKLTELQSKEKDISKKIADLQSALIDNQNEQKNQQTDLDNQKAKLELLKAKTAHN